MIKINVFILNSLLSSHQRELLLSRLSEIEKSSLPKETNKNYDASLASKVILKKMVANQIGVFPKQIILSKTQLGKPYVLQPQSINIDVSISHSGQYLAIAFCSGGKIGVDIEFLRNFDVIEVKTFFSAEELDYISCSRSKENELKSFYKVWTLKESYLKVTGQGIYEDFPEIKFAGEKTRVLKKNNETYYFSSAYRSGFTLSVCTNNKISSNFLERELTITNFTASLMEMICQENSWNNF